ncbi:Hypothetical protein, putative [Bodo saltans]|uniref:Uncharacterized protein n=1 Tax=Bodo saltans TaxID=75058 RepID=A0A0S4JMA7_BODSA|nr:Hypothetical protein, putative [Bodo saltans]|eukprot:CUG92654.1 Hypothetical protein, putative [Bodo saltans]
MPTSIDPSQQLYLPVSLCEALETSGASSVASIATVTTPSGQELVIVGSSDGHVYVVSGSSQQSHETLPKHKTTPSVSWRLLATEHRLFESDTNESRSQRWEVPVHQRIQSLVAISSSSSNNKGNSSSIHTTHQAAAAGTDSTGGSPSTSLVGSMQNPVHPTLLDTPVRPGPPGAGDDLYILVLSVQRATKTAMVHVYFVPNIDSLLSRHDDGGEKHLFPAMEWRKMMVPAGQAFPLRMFVDKSFSIPVGLERSGDAPDAHHILLSGMEMDSAAPHVLTGAVGIITLPFTGVLGSTPPALHWLTPSSTSSSSPVGSPNRNEQKYCLSWMIARAVMKVVAAPIIALSVLTLGGEGAPMIVVAGCVDGEVVAVQLPPTDTPTLSIDGGANTVVCIRCSGPVADLLVYHPRVHLTFPIPNAVLDELEECRYNRQLVVEDDHLRRVIVLDSSGKVLMMVFQKKSATDVSVTITRLPDYTTVAEAKVAPEFVASVLADSTKSGGQAPSNSKAAPAAPSQRRLAAFPDMALGIQNRLAAVSNFFRNQDKLQPAADILASAASTSESHQTPHMSSSAEHSTISITSQRDNMLGALLGAGPIAISQCDVNGDGLYELVITTMGRFVALYRFLPESGTFACIEAAEAPTHLFFCKQVRLWSHTAVPAWVMCGPSHILAHCGSTLRDIIASRAFLLERCLVGESLLET